MGELVIHTGLKLNGSIASGSGEPLLARNSTTSILQTQLDTGGNPFMDNETLIRNSSDPTKLAKFSAASLSTGTTRTYTLPNSDGTLLLSTEAWKTSGTTTLTGHNSIQGSFNILFGSSLSPIPSFTAWGSSVSLNTPSVAFFDINNFGGSGGNVTLNDQRATKRGIEYAADYSSTFTSRSLVDKAYVDSVAGSGSWSTSGTTTLIGNPNIDFSSGSGYLTFTTESTGHIIKFGPALALIELTNPSNFVTSYYASGISNSFLGVGQMFAISSVGDIEISSNTTTTLKGTSGVTISSQFGDINIISDDASGDEIICTTPGFRVEGVTNSLTGSLIQANKTFNPSSGTNNHTVVNLTPTWNTTGSYVGTVRGIYYNPTNTSLTGATHIAFENTSGELRFGGVTQDDTKTQVLVQDSSTKKVFWRDSSTLGGGTSGEFTPTSTNITNVDSSTPQEGQYIKVDNVVTVSGFVTIDPTAGGSATTEIALTLPVAATFTVSNQCAGIFTSTMASVSGTVVGLVSGGTTGSSQNKALFQFKSPQTGAIGFYYTYTYRLTDS